MTTTSNVLRVLLALMWFLSAVKLQTGGIGWADFTTADDITLRQATCEIVSAVFLVGSALLLWMPKETSNG